MSVRGLATAVALAALAAPLAAQEQDGGEQLLPVVIHTDPWSAGEGPVHYHGYMNTSGELVLGKFGDPLGMDGSVSYVHAGRFYDGLAAVDFNLPPLGDPGPNWDPGYSAYVIDTTGQIVGQFPEPSPDFAVPEAITNGRWLKKTSWGYFAAAQPYPLLYAFSGGLHVRQTGPKQWKYFDETGKVVLTLDDTLQATSFFDDLAWVVVETADGPRSSFVNRKGERAFTLDGYGMVSGFSSGLAIVRRESDLKYLFIDTQGQPAFEQAFDVVQFFSEGLAAAAVRDEGARVQARWGYVGRDGAWVIEPKFGQANPFSEGFAVVGSLGETAWVWSYIDKTGAPAFDKEFSSAGPFVEGWAQVVHEGQGAYLNTRGELLRLVLPQEKD